MSRNRLLLDKLASKGGNVTFADALPQSVKDRLGVKQGDSRERRESPQRTDTQASRVHTVIDRGDPRMLAAHLLAGDIAAGEIPSQLREAVLACVQQHHTAVTARTDETIRAQRHALEQANQTARARDESHVQVEGAVDHQRRTAQEMGRQVADLHRDLERSRQTIEELEEALRASRAETLELRGEMVILREEQLGLTEGAIFRSFLDLVNVRVPEWLNEREGLFRKAEFLCTSLEQKAAGANDLLSEVRADVEDAEAAKVDRTFDGDESTWTLYLEKVAQMRRHLAEHVALLLEVQRLSQQRTECTDYYEGLDRKGKELTFTICSVVHVFFLIGEDVWARADVKPELLDSLDPSNRVIRLMMQAIPAEELSEDWMERVDALQSYILEPKKKRSEKKVAAPVPVQIHFFPGRIFMVEPEREVERLVGILLSELQLSGFNTALFPDEITTLLMRSGLSSLVREQLSVQVISALAVLSARGVVSRHPRYVEELRMTSKAYTARDRFCEQYARAELAQVEGGHGELLKGKLKRVMPTTES